MTDGRTAALARLVAPPGPTSARAVATWETLDDDARARLRRAATDRSLAATTDADHHHVVHDLARRRAERRLLDVVVPVVTGLLVFSTLWGFGRAAFPADAEAWLAAGLVGLVAVAAVGLRRATRRRRAAASVLRALDDRGSVGP